MGGACGTVKLEQKREQLQVAPNWPTIWADSPLTLVGEQLVLQFLGPENVQQLGVVEYVIRLVPVQVELGRVAQLRVFGY